MLDVATKGLLGAVVDAAAAVAQQPQSHAQYAAAALETLEGIVPGAYPAYADDVVDEEYYEEEQPRRMRRWETLRRMAR